MYRYKCVYKPIYEHVHTLLKSLLLSDNNTVIIILYNCLSQVNERLYLKAISANINTEIGIYNVKIEGAWHNPE